MKRMLAGLMIGLSGVVCAEPQETTCRLVSTLITNAEREDYYTRLAQAWAYLESKQLDHWNIVKEFQEDRDTDKHKLEALIRTRCMEQEKGL